LNKWSVDINLQKYLYNFFKCLSFLNRRRLDFEQLGHLDWFAFTQITKDS
jgi:hypothetical protein